jgi:hypothetical protein
VLELLGHDRARMTIAPVRQATSEGTTGAAQVELAGAPATPGAPVFVNERAVGLIADQDGSRRSVMPIDDLAAILASEPLAALH